MWGEGFSALSSDDYKLQIDKTALFKQNTKYLETDQRFSVVSQNFSKISSVVE